MVASRFLLVNEAVSESAPTVVTIGRLTFMPKDSTYCADRKPLGGPDMRHLATDERNIEIECGIRQRYPLSKYESLTNPALRAKMTAVADDSFGLATIFR